MIAEEVSSSGAKWLVIKLVGALIGGTLLGFSFFTETSAFLIIFGLVIGLITFLKASKVKTAALLGFTFGFSFFLVQSSWLIALSTFAGSWSYLAWLALSFIESMAFILFAVITQVIHRKVRDNLLTAIKISLVFVALEILRSIGPWSYPWGLVAVPGSQFKMIASLAADFGWPGLSFVVVFISSLVALFIFPSLDGRGLRGGWQSNHPHPNPPPSRGRGLTVIFILLLLFINWGQSPPTTNHQSLAKVAVLQTNVNMLDKWQEKKAAANFEELKKLIKSVPKEANLIFGPESAVPGIYPQNKAYLQDLNNLSSPKLIIGSLRDEKGRIYNSVFGGQRIYDKNKLVLLGEYIPFAFLTEYIKPLRGSLTAGQSAKSLGNVGVLICSESADWLYARALINDGAQLISVITNDGWFKKSSLPFQHLQLSRLRAIENGRYVVMAANYGYSAIIRSDGEIINKSELGKSQVLNGTVYRLQKKTFFSKYGDKTTWLFLLLGIYTIVMAFFLQS